MSGEVCGDDRFELIAKAKGALMERTNIEMAPDEMAVIDSILFRCWQMGWLDRLRDGGTRYSEMFGTPERAARTLENGTPLCGWCDTQTCEKRGGECSLLDYDVLLEWLKGSDA